MAVKKIPQNDISAKIDVIGKKLDGLVSVVVGHDKRFDSIDKKFDSIDKKFDSIDKKFTSIDKRFDLIDKRFDSVDKKFESNDATFVSIDTRFNVMDSKIDRVIGTMATKDELRALESRLAEIERTNQHIANATDGMVGTYETLYVEYAAIKHQLSRHDRWFEELSKRTGAKLEY